MIGDITVLIAFIIFLAISGYVITYVAVALLFGITLLVNFIVDVITAVMRSIRRRR